MLSDKISVEIYKKQGKASQANSLLEECGGSSSNWTVNYLLNNDSVLEIALVVPLSGEMKEFGQDIYNGAVIAAELYRKENNRSIKINPYDTKGDPIEAARLIKEIASNGNADVVVGPLTSEEAGVSSAVLSCLSLPMIVPAATQAGLTRLSETSYQLSPNIELEGITLAEYAVNVLKADTVVILSSTATDQLRMSRAFAEHYQRLGGTVAAVEYFRNRDKDFGSYLLDVKKSLLGVPEDSTELINYDGDTLDYEDVPIYIDCFFIAGNGRQLKQLLPQINYHNMHGYYLGSDGWGDETVYKLGDDITKQAVFASPFLEGSNSEQYLKLAVEYDRRYGSQPQRLTALGYDAVSIILNSLGSQIVDRTNISESLKLVKDYVGASGKISFGKYRENIEMPMYKIVSEQAELLNLNNSEQPQ